MNGDKIDLLIKVIPNTFQILRVRPGVHTKNKYIVFRVTDSSSILTIYFMFFRSTNLKLFVT